MSFYSIIFLSIFSCELLNSSKYFQLFIIRDYTVLIECIFHILVTNIHNIILANDRNAFTVFVNICSIPRNIL